MAMLCDGACAAEPGSFAYSIRTICDPAAFLFSVTIIKNGIHLNDPLSFPLLLPTHNIVHLLLVEPGDCVEQRQ